MMTACVLFASHNAGKVREVRNLLAPFGIVVMSAGELQLDEPEETGSTFLENARIKAHAAAQATGLPAISDDSGLEIDALDGAPGVYTADWSMTPGGTRDPMLSMTRIMQECATRETPLPSPARYRCCLVLAWPNGQDHAVDGTIEGTAIWPPRGKNGFGEDPIFVPEGHDRTFGEMPDEEKATLSHRARAWERMISHLETLFLQKDHLDAEAPHPV